MSLLSLYYEVTHSLESVNPINTIKSIYDKLIVNITFTYENSHLKNLSLLFNYCVRNFFPKLFN